MYDDIPHNYHRLTPHKHTSNHHVSQYLTQYVSLCSHCARVADGGDGWALYNRYGYRRNLAFICILG